MLHNTRAPQKLFFTRLALYKILLRKTGWMREDYLREEFFVVQVQLHPVGVEELGLGTCKSLAKISIKAPTLRSLDLK